MASAIFEISRGGGGIEEFSGSMGGWQIFRIEGDGLCRIMSFSRRVQTPGPRTLCLYGLSRYMETHIASVETVLVYNRGGASSSNEVNL